MVPAGAKLWASQCAPGPDLLRCSLATYNYEQQGRRVKESKSPSPFGLLFPWDLSALGTYVLWALGGAGERLLRGGRAGRIGSGC